MRDVTSWHSTAHGSAVRLVAGRTDLIQRVNSNNDDDFNGKHSKTCNTTNATSASTASSSRCCSAAAVAGGGVGGGGVGGGAIAFSARPVKQGQKVTIHVRQRRRTSRRLPGSLRVGFTRHDPSTLQSDQLPVYLVPDLTDRDGYWARPVGPEVKHLSRVTVWFSNADNCVYWELDGEYRGRLVDRLDDEASSSSMTSLWLVVDLYPPVTALRLVPPGERSSSAIVYSLLCLNEISN